MLINTYFIKDKGMGLGDFIRGSIATRQLCSEYGIPFQVDLSHHPIGNYLIPNCDYPAQSIEHVYNFQDIPHFKIADLKRNLTCRFNLLSLRRRQTVHIYTNVWPNFKISPVVANSIKSFFTPNEFLENEINQKIKNIKDYGVIHIRAGDILSFKTQIGDVVNCTISDIINNMDSFLKTIDNKKYLILSDCAELKNEIIRKYNFIDVQTVPAHLTLSNYSIVDTLIDYFILTRASHIHQFSVHYWGSGFSDSAKWLYGVPVLKHQLFS